MNDSGSVDFWISQHLYIEKDVCHIEETHIHTVISETPHRGMEIKFRFSTAENNPVKMGSAFCARGNQLQSPFGGYTCLVWENITLLEHKNQLRAAPNE